MKQAWKLLAVSSLVASSISVMAGGVAPKPVHYFSRLSTGPFYSTEVDVFGLFDLFVPYTFNPDSLAFFDARYIENKGPTHEYNLGLGFRHILSNQRMMVGGYGFFDRRRSPYGNDFSQLTFGGEFKTVDWSVVANGYIPVGTSSYRTSALNATGLVNAGIYKNISYRLGIEKSMGGADVLVGYTIPYGHRLSLYAGGFYFTRKNVPSDIGPMLQAQYSVLEVQGRHHISPFKVSLIANWETSKHYNSRWFAGARLDVFFARRYELTGIQNRMEEFVRRDLKVRTGVNINAPTHLLLNADGTPVRVRQVSGSQANLQTAVNDTNANIVAVDGAINVAGVVTTVPDNRFISGNNYLFTVDGQQLSVAISHNAAVTGTGTLFQVNDNATIQNIAMTTTGTGTNAAVTDNNGANEVQNLLIDNVTVNGSLLDINPNTAGFVDSIVVQDSQGTSAINKSTVSIDSQQGTVNFSLLRNHFTALTGAQLVAVNGAATPTAILNITQVNGNVLTSVGGQAFVMSGQQDATFTLGEMVGNVFSSEAGSSTVALNGLNTITGDIRNNIFNNGHATGQAFSLSLGNTQHATTMNGGIFGNSFRAEGSPTTGAVSILADSPAAAFNLTIQGGFYSNQISCQAAGCNGLSISNSSANASLLQIDGLNNNTITSGAAGIAFTTGNALERITINVQDGSRGLSAANNNVAIDITGVTAGTLTVNPPL